VQDSNQTQKKNNDKKKKKKKKNKGKIKNNLNGVAKESTVKDLVVIFEFTRT
jgi:hypothetical protein